MIYGAPDGTDRREFAELRRQIVSSVATTMKVNPDWVRVFFPEDLLQEPINPSEGATTVYVRLETAMFSTEPGEITPKNGLDPDVTVGAIGDIVWNAFNGAREVEVCIVQLHPSWKALLSPNE